MKARNRFIAVVVIACAATAEAAPRPAAVPSAAALQTISDDFALFDHVCAKSRDLWGITSCGSLMLVDAETHQAVANAADNGAVLKPAGAGRWSGVLPADLVVANTVLEFGGRQWAVVLQPLPDDVRQRAVLLAHEAFHRIQLELGLSGGGTEGINTHLDREQGRVWLLLELRALDRALTALAAGLDPRHAARDALAFRSERYRRFPTAADEEARLERVEGTAEYTGVVAAAADRAGRIALAHGDLSRLPERRSFSRSFAYATGPAYGLLLDAVAGADWRWRFIEGATFVDLLGAAVGSLPAAANRVAAYDGGALLVTEQTREQTRARVEGQLRAALLDGPVIVLPISGSIGFDPGSVTALEGSGTVYRHFETTGSWGKLTSEGPALVTPDWSNVRVAAAGKIDLVRPEGQGWHLALSPGWLLAPSGKGNELMPIKRATP